MHLSYVLRIGVVLTITLDCNVSNTMSQSYTGNIKMQVFHLNNFEIQLNKPLGYFVFQYPTSIFPTQNDKSK